MDQMLRATARAEDRHFWFLALRRNAARALADALGSAEARWIVDCGSGTGRNLDWLGRSGRAVGIELTQTGLDVARQAHRPVVRATVASLPVAERSADVVTSFDVLYCLADDREREAIAEMWRVLKPGGVAVINVAALDVLRGAHSTLTHEVRRYTRPRLRERLESAGFVIERLTYTNMVTFPVALAVRTLDRVTGRATRPSDADLRVPPAPVNALFDGLLRVESLLLRWVNLPVGTSLLCVARKPRAPSP